MTMSIKSKFILVAVFMLISTNKVWAQEAPSEYILFIGQSNMAGRSPFDASMDYRELLSVKQFAANSWIKVENVKSLPDSGVNRFSSMRKTNKDQLLSPAYAFAKTLPQNNKLGIMVEARSDLSIKNFQEYAPMLPYSDHTKNLFNMIMDRVNAASSSGSHLAGIVFLQGESDYSQFGDGVHTKNMDEYLNLLSKFIYSMRISIGDRDLPIFVSQLAPATGPSGGTYTYENQIEFNSRIHEITHRKSNVYIIPAQDLKTLYQENPETNNHCPSDCVHFNRNSALTLGQRMAYQVRLHALNGLSPDIIVVLL